MEELRSTFHKEIEEIRQEVLSLGRSVIEAIPRATAVLLNSDLEGADYLLQADDEIDARAIDIEEKCFQELALQSPVAGDLRELVSMIKIAGELERSADLAVNICKAARRIYGHKIDPVQVLNEFRNLLRQELGLEKMDFHERPFDEISYFSLIDCAKESKSKKSRKPKVE